MKRIIATLVGLSLWAGAFAQEYKLAKNTGRLQIMEVNHVSIEGYDGNEIVFTSTNRDRQKDKRAEGLRALSSLGLEDNTGLGLSVVNKENVIAVRQLKKTEGPDIRILVPKGVVVSYTHSSPYGDAIEVSNFDGAVEITTVHSGVVLTSLRGKVSVKTVHGNIDASMGNPLNGVVSLESVHGHVDVALPLATKANLTLGTNWGEVLVDPDFKIELDRSGKFVSYSEKIKGTLNGGGTDITLTSDHNNVYLRKK